MTSTRAVVALFSTPLLVAACADGSSGPNTSGTGGDATQSSAQSAGGGGEGGGGSGGADDGAAWDAFAEVDGKIVLLLDGPDDGVWLVTSTSPAFEPLDYDATLLRPDLTPKCSVHLADPDLNGGAWIAPAVDPDGNLVLAKRGAEYDLETDTSRAWTDVTRLDASCNETPWLHLEGLGCYQDSTGGTMRRHAVATRDAVFLACGVGGASPVPVVATDGGYEDLVSIDDPFFTGQTRLTMIRSASGDEVLVVCEDAGRVLLVDGSTGSVNRDEIAYEGGMNGADAGFSTYAASLARAGDGYVGVVHRAVTVFVGGVGAVSYEDEVVSLLPDRTAGELQPWPGVETSVPAPTSLVPSFYSLRDQTAILEDTWLSWGVQATTGLGDAGILAKSTATLRVVERDGTTQYAPLAGVGRSAPVGMTRTTSGAMVVALAYEQSLTLETRRFDSGKTILARSEHPARLADASAATADGCKLFEEACVRCVDQYRTDRCYSDDLECIPLLVSASSCACGAQLDGADDATVRACFDPIDAITAGYVTTEVFRTTCAAECL